MKSIRILLRHNALLFYSFVLWVVCGLTVLACWDKLEIHSMINAWVGQVCLDIFFKYITYLGDGLFTLIVVLLLLLFSLRKGLILLLSYALAGGITQVLKTFVFVNSNRPFFYHAYENYPLKVVDGVNMHIHNSFPSGHATAAFNLFFVLGFFIPNPWLKAFAFIMAFLTAFSRVYLSQHFLEDVLTGSIIAVFVASLVVAFGLYSRRTFGLSWHEKGILSYFLK